MHFTCVTALLLSLLGNTALTSILPEPKWSIDTRKLHYVVEPKVVIISMFEPEGDVWYDISEFNVLEKVGRLRRFTCRCIGCDVQVQ